MLLINQGFQDDATMYIFPRNKMHFSSRHKRTHGKKERTLCPSYVLVTRHQQNRKSEEKKNLAWSCQPQKRKITGASPPCLQRLRFAATSSDASRVSGPFCALMFLITVPDQLWCTCNWTAQPDKISTQGVFLCRRKWDLI